MTIRVVVADDQGMVRSGFSILLNAQPDIEVVGEAVNGQEAVVNGDGSFHHFTNPLPTGENMITVTAQNSKGGVNTVTKPVVIQ